MASVSIGALPGRAITPIAERDGRFSAPNRSACLLYTSALAYYTILQIQSNLVLGPCSTTLKIPYNVPQAAILVGWILMGFYPLLRMFREIGLFIVACQKRAGELEA